MTDPTKTDVPITIQIAGKKTIVRLSNFDGADVRDFRNVVGFAPARAFSEPGLMDLDVMAAMVWLTRRKLSPQTTYDSLLKSITYDNAEVTFDYRDANDDGTEDDDEGADPADPEA